MCLHLHLNLLLSLAVAMGREGRTGEELGGAAGDVRRRVGRVPRLRLVGLHGSKHYVAVLALLRGQKLREAGIGRPRPVQKEALIIPGVGRQGEDAPEAAPGPHGLLLPRSRRLFQVVGNDVRLEAPKRGMVANGRRAAEAVPLAVIRPRRRRRTAAFWR